jgi:hypothetical protein
MCHCCTLRLYRTIPPILVNYIHFISFLKPKQLRKSFSTISTSNIFFVLLESIISLQHLPLDLHLVLKMFFLDGFSSLCYLNELYLYNVPISRYTLGFEYVLLHHFSSSIHCCVCTIFTMSPYYVVITIDALSHCVAP